MSGVRYVSAQTVQWQSDYRVIILAVLNVGYTTRAYLLGTREVFETRGPTPPSSN